MFGRLLVLQVSNKNETDFVWFRGRGGLYLEGASVAGPAPEGAGMDIEAYGYAAWAFDEAREVALWALSKKLVGVA